MQVNLKKAHKLVKQLRDVASELSVKEVLSISVYSDTSEEAISSLLSKKTSQLNDKVNSYVRITETVYKIRQLIDDKNHDKGVSKTLNRLNYCKDILAKFGTVSPSKRKHDPYAEILEIGDENPEASLLSKKANALRTNSSSVSYGSRGDAVSASVSGTLPFEISMIKKEKSNLEDEILALNVSAKINLPDEVVEVLKENDLLD